MTPKEKAIELIELHKCLSLGDCHDFALVFCDWVIRGNTRLTDEQHEYWKQVQYEITQHKN